MTWGMQPPKEQVVRKVGKSNTVWVSLLKTKQSATSGL